VLAGVTAYFAHYDKARAHLSLELQCAAFLKGGPPAFESWTSCDRLRRRLAGFRGAGQEVRAAP